MAQDDEILSLLDLWFETLAMKGTPAKVAPKVAELYTPDAVLVPTLWNGPCFGRKAIQNYFEATFLPVEPKGFLINYLISRDGDIAVNSGHYVFEIKDCKTKEEEEDDCKPGRVNKNARFTFVYKKTSEGWKIVAHHSSKMPEEHSKTVIQWIRSEAIV